MAKKYFFNFFLLCVIITIFSNNRLFAQVAISYPVPAQDITVNYYSSLLTVRINVNQNLTSGANITIAFPSGVTYVAGSLQTTTATAGLTIANSGGSPSAPQFTIAPGNLAIGNYIIFTIAREANCAARLNSISGTIFKDAVTVVTSAGTVQDSATAINNYIIGYPAFSIGQPAATTNVILGQVYTRTFTIANGGNGCTENVYLQIDYPAGGIQQISLKVNNIPIFPTTTIGTIKYYTITGALINAGQEFCNGDILTFKEEFKVLKCEGITNYNTGWGPNANSATRCDTDSGIGTVIMANGSPLLAATSNTLIGYTNKCNPFTIRTTFLNSGTGNVNAAAMYNIVLKKCDVYDYYGYPSSLMVLTTAKIGGNIITQNYVPANNLPISGPGKFYEVNTANFFTTDPDGAGVGLEDVDKDGFYDDLPSGATVTLDIAASFNCSLLPCNTDRLLYILSSIVKYNTMCDTTQIISNLIQPSGIALTDFVYSHITTGSAPANITPLVPFRIRLSESSYFNVDDFRTANSKFVYEITLPTGVTISGTGNPIKIYGNGPNIPTTITQIGNIVRFSESANLGTYYGYVDLIYNCAIGGNVNSLSFPYKYIEVNDSVANCLCNSDIACGILNTNTSCPTPCPSGPTTQYPIVERANNSLGWTNNSLTTRVARSSISAFDLSKALYLDTIEIKSNGSQNGNSSNLGLHFELPKTASGVNKLTPINIQVILRRSGIDINTVTLTSFVMTGSTATIQKIDWDLTAVLLFGGFQNGDTFRTVSRYQVTSNELTQHDTQSGGLFYFFNTVAGVKQNCNAFIAEMYLVGTYYINGNNPQNVSGCTPAALGGGTNYLARRFDSSGIMYQNEYRPGCLITSIKATLPIDYTFVSATYIDVFSGATFPLTPASIVGQVYTFNNLGTWPTFPVSVTNNYGAYVPFTLQATCSTKENIYREDVFEINYKDFYYAYGNPTVTTYDTVTPRAQGITYNNTPNIVLTNLSGTIQVTKPTESILVRLSSNGFAGAPYDWIAIPDIAGITITQVVDLATAAVISPNLYPGGKLYYLSSAALAPSAFIDFRIYFSISTCAISSFNILGGWNCDDFPTDPNLYTCSKDTLTLNFTQVGAEIQVSETTVAVTSGAFCVPKNYSFEINNAQASNVYQNTFTLKMPVGLIPVGGSFEAEYPRNSGNWLPVFPPTITGNQYEYDLSSYANYPLQGIPGTLNSVSIDDRFMKIRFKTTTDCSYVSGTKFLFSTAALSSCGSKASGSDIDNISGN